MKKNILVLIFISFCLFICGCSTDEAKYINFSSKPNNHYYTDRLYKRILNNEKFTLYVFDTNLYKELEVPEEDKDIIENFVHALIEDNYSSEDISDKEPFRLKVFFKDEKFLIKIYNADTISISSWDGSYKPDTVSMGSVPLGYNLYDFCNHIKNQLKLE